MIPQIGMNSIDEAVIDLTDTLGLFKGSILDIGKQIKKRFREEIGEWMKCSIGVGTNRFLAKLAASLHKPDGLDVIDHKTCPLRPISGCRFLTLVASIPDFRPGSNAYGIFTPWSFIMPRPTFSKNRYFKASLGITGIYA